MAHEAHGTDSAAPTGGRLATSTRSTLLGAMFLMATSAIGPGFITQTTTFTVRLGAAFAFAIVISILIDIALQLNVWRVIGVSGRRAQELGNLVFPGLGWVMAAFLLIGGLVFNIGNVAGSGLGLDAMLGLDPKLGGALSALIAIGIFLSRKAGVAVDRIVVVLGLVMIALTTYVAITSGPPVGQALGWPGTRPASSPASASCAAAAAFADRSASRGEVVQPASVRARIAAKTRMRLLRRW